RDVPVQSEAQPHLQVAGVRKVRVVAADMLLNFGADDDGGGGDQVFAGAAEVLEEVAAGGNGPLILMRRGEGQRLAVPGEAEELAVGHDDVGIRIHHGGGAGERAGGRQIVGGEQQEIVVARPGDAFVVRGDVSFIGL